MKNKKLNVYDTVNKKYIELEVSDEIYIAYKQTGWDIANNNKSFYQHEIQLSALKGSLDNGYENFHEFVSLNKSLETSITIIELKKALEKISLSDRNLIKMLYFDGMTELECTEKLGTTQQNIHKKKYRILCKLYKLLNSQ